ncbi:hypothetical protein BDZ89DRAFT_338328 [Hymenopellis radicata]|nr:hypothetical protein BDZ89DRAFT_338328 [Hymenopellis radicata]
MVGKWCRRCSLLRCSGPFSAAVSPSCSPASSHATSILVRLIYIFQSIPSSINPSAQEICPSLATQLMPRSRHVLVGFCSNEERHARTMAGT